MNGDWFFVYEWKLLAFVDYEWKKGGKDGKTPPGKGGRLWGVETNENLYYLSCNFK
jgi:hypothetical protein